MADALSSTQLRREASRLAQAYSAFFSGFPAPSAARLTDLSREPPLLSEADVARIPDARVEALQRAWVRGTGGAWARGLRGAEAEEGAGGGSGGVAGICGGPEYSETEAVVYVAARMPSTYAAVKRVLHEVRGARAVREAHVCRGTCRHSSSHVGCRVQCTLPAWEVPGRCRASVRPPRRGQGRGFLGQPPHKGDAVSTQRGGSMRCLA